MSQDNHLDRRDILKIGGLAAISLPLLTEGCTTASGESTVTSDAAYGGFTVIPDAGGRPAIEVNDAIYERFDATNAIFSRIIWDDEMNAKLAALEKAFDKGDAGYTQMDAALNAGSVLLGTYNGSNSPMMGRHAGLLGFDIRYMSPPTHPTFDERFDTTKTTPENVAAAVKKAALFYGASLVGIAPLDVRWLYSNFYDVFHGGRAPIEISKVETPELPEGQISPEDAGKLVKAEMRRKNDDEIKQTVIDVLESADSDLLPPGAPPVRIVKVLPAKEFRNKLSVFTKMPTPVLRIFMEKLGMDLRIANVDPGESGRPRYLEDGTLAIPETMKTVIVLAFEMDRKGIDAAPTNLGDVPTMDGYSKMAVTAGALSVFLRSLGFNAIPCGNNTGISVPMAIQAGLGEAGRHGILITPKYGPRVRLAKVITDLPMAHDKPIRFGVKEFCEVCMKCAQHCPTKAIPTGPRTTEASTISSSKGVLKWAVNAEKCYEGWTINGSGCGVCIKTCPFNKPESWLHDATRILIGADSGSLDSLMVKLDDASGFGSPEPDFGFWVSDEYMHIKG